MRSTPRDTTRRDTSRPGTGTARRRLTAAGLLAVLLGGGLAVVTPAAASASAAFTCSGGLPTPVDGNSLIGHLNAFRAQHGLRPLALNSYLSSVAAAHSAAMARSRTLVHNDIQNAISNWQVVGENIGTGPSVASVNACWDASPGHRANELNAAYTEVGFGTASAGGQLYITADFRKPMTPDPRPAAGSPTPTRSTTPSRPVVTPTHVPTAAERAATAAATAKADAAAKAEATAKAQATAATTRAAAQRRAALAQENARLTQLDDPLARALKFQNVVARLDG